MSLHVTYTADTATFVIGNGTQTLEGVTPAEYREFVNDIRDGLLNPSALMRQATARRNAELAH